METRKSVLYWNGFHVYWPLAQLVSFADSIFGHCAPGYIFCGNFGLRPLSTFFKVSACSFQFHAGWSNFSISVHLWKLYFCLSFSLKASFLKWKSFQTVQGYVLERVLKSMQMPYRTYRMHTKYQITMRI